MRRIAIVAFMFILIPASMQAKKEKKQVDIQHEIDKENRNFEKKVGKHPNDANIYWQHANNLCKFKGDAGLVANIKENYQQALAYDTSNGIIYKDYANFLVKTINYDETKSILTKGLKLLPTDEQMKKQLVAIEAILNAQAIDSKMKSVGISTIREIDTQKNYHSYSNLDSIRQVVKDPTNKMYYPLLLERFNNEDKSLTAEDMYFLIIGYSTQSAYKPFNKNELLALQMVSSSNLDTGISAGLDLLGTNPLNPAINREIMYYYRKKGLNKLADRYENRVKMFYSGILFSGNGSCNKPYISLWGKEEYTFLNYIQFKGTDVKSMEMCNGQMVEMIQCNNEVKGGKENIYFNMRLIYLQSANK